MEKHRNERAVLNVSDAILSAYIKARQKHAPMRGPHEGYAIIKEEFDELWEEIRKWQPDDENKDAMRKEALHTGAMVLAFLIEVVGE